MSDDFSKLIKDVEGLSIKVWIKRYPNFYAWLMKNGFRYNPKLDKTIKDKGEYVAQNKND